MNIKILWGKYDKFVLWGFHASREDRNNEGSVVTTPFVLIASELEADTRTAETA